MALEKRNFKLDDLLPLIVWSSFTKYVCKNFQLKKLFPKAYKITTYFSSTQRPA
jgi:hypothetical protein